MNIALQKAIDRGEENIEVIVRFQDSIEEQDYRVLNGLGVEVGCPLRVLPSVLIHANREQVIMLSHYERVDYMELNEELEYLMHDTTTYINATIAWASLIEDQYGEIIQSQPGSNRYIDGTGVTVVILDTGIDAGHPDFDYGTKVIKNLKRTEAGWTEQENTDTSSGHGTHCAGTAAGNGDASSMARSGVAPKANLIGLGTGEGLSIIYAIEGLEWVYENSRPDNNPHNIRVVSNSWGTGGNEGVYDPQSSISIISDRLTYENHVSVIFAAGNSGGDGSSVRTNPYSNTPSVISVAAFERRGDGLADFSSRGNREKKHSWPDIGAPGHIIWSCAPRETVIDIAQRPSDHELYYMEISGTSMATPHVAGAAALLWQAAPHMGTSEIHEDYSGDNAEEWDSNPRTLVSDIELIFKLTARYMRGVTGVPAENATGVGGHPHDFAQGYGYIDMRAAVGLALTLEALRTRDLDDDGLPDNPNASVFDACGIYRKTMLEKYVSAPTNVLKTDWTGDWAHFEAQALDPSVGTYSTNNTRFVYVPEETKEIELTLSYAEYETERMQWVDLYLALSLDGGNDFDPLTPESVNEGVKHYVLRKGSDFSESDTGKLWAFRTEGTGIGIKVNDEFFEPIAAFTVSMREILELSNESVTVDFQMARSFVATLEFGTPTPDYSGGMVTMMRYVYEYPAEKIQPDEDDDDDFPVAVAGTVGAVVLLGALGGLLFLRKRK
ncbi:MAG: S8 family serine peptidase [Thermoplasmata archaeon]|nr:S8 family serine peptidase [Thermoplasmata archaeon]